MIEIKNVKKVEEFLNGLMDRKVEMYKNVKK